MKVEATLLIMCLLGRLSYSSKVLKVPRVYNAFVTSNDDLQPSQTYPVLTPVVQGVQYALPRYVSSNVYRSLVVPNHVQYSDTRVYSSSVHTTVKENYYQYNIVETAPALQFEMPAIMMVEEKSPYETILFRHLEPLHVESANSGKATPKVGDHHQLVYFDSSPVQPDDNSAHDSRPLESNVNDVRLLRAQRYHGTHGSSLTEEANVDTSGPSEVHDAPRPNEAVKGPRTDSTFNGYIEVDDAVKNNRPKDRSIVDVPPPPIPVRIKPPKKKPDTGGRIEEHLPPPVGFI